MGSVVEDAPDSFSQISPMPTMLKIANLSWCTPLVMLKEQANYQNLEGSVAPLRKC